MLRVLDLHGFFFLDAGLRHSIIVHSLNKGALLNQEERRTSKERLTFDILTVIEREDTVTQRGISRELGIALGLTNSLVKRLARQGLVRISHLRARRLRYYLTPRGIAEKSRLAKLSLQHTLRLYTTTRDRIRKRLEELGDGHAVAPRLVFYGTGDVAEIAFVVVRYTGLQLVGVVDDQKVGTNFCGLKVRSSSFLQEQEAYDKVIVTSLSGGDHIGQIGIDPSRIVHL